MFLIITDIFFKSRIKQINFFFIHLLNISETGEGVVEEMCIVELAGWVNALSPNLYFNIFYWYSTTSPDTHGRVYLDLVKSNLSSVQ